MRHRLASRFTWASRSSLAGQQLLLSPPLDSGDMSARLSRTRPQKPKAFRSDRGFPPFIISSLDKDGQFLRVGVGKGFKSSLLSSTQPPQRLALMAFQNRFNKSCEKVPYKKWLDSRRGWLNSTLVVSCLSGSNDKSEHLLFVSFGF